MEDEDSEIFLMSLPSIDTQYVNIDLLKQVYDGLLQKWFSIKGHRETIEEYWVQVSDKEMADGYIKNYYDNIVVDFYSKPKSAMEDDISKYICFFVAPMAPLEDYLDNFCTQCQASGYIDCEECDTMRLYCDECDDVFEGPNKYMFYYFKADEKLKDGVVCINNRMNGYTDLTR